eukprot:maker-scaffold_13-snap-gene-6.65-mRNA-1 protein AED:0.09 eAED:0.09 QI:0/0.75/0.8/1/1/1/5/57/286
MADRCYTCSKRVYFNEKVVALGKLWYKHKSCFRCTDCNKVLARGSQSEHGGLPYCHACYQKAYGARGFRSGTMVANGNYDGKSPVLSPAKQWTLKRSQSQQTLSKPNTRPATSSFIEVAPSSVSSTKPAVDEASQSAASIETKDVTDPVMVPEPIEARREPRADSFVRKSFQGLTSLLTKLESDIEEIKSVSSRVREPEPEEPSKESLSTFVRKSFREINGRLDKLDNQIENVNRKVDDVVENSSIAMEQQAPPPSPLKTLRESFSSLFNSTRELTSEQEADKSDI